VVQSVCNIPNILTTGRFDRTIRSLARAAPHSPGFVLTRVAAETLVCTSRAYASLHAACLSGLVTLNLRSNSWRISRARAIPILQIDHQPPFIEPSANSDFIDPIQLPNLVFDLCDIHNDSSAPEPLKIARRTSLTPPFSRPVIIVVA
jgi:hypothetical protein